MHDDAPTTRSPAALAAHLARHGRFASAALDALCAQRDAHTSLLYWHTDLDAARAEARRARKPILSLRLLGRLDEELSCANSRFFRATLYPDPVVNALLRDRFVLHWRSVRPVPVVTIDFGDGRRLVRTLTGNSVHLVLDADGRPRDAIPGLYSAPGFARALAPHAGVAFPVDARTPAPPVLDVRAATGLPSTRADVAGGLALTKRMVEAPILNGVRELFATIAEDEARNERALRPRIRARLRAAPREDADALTTWIYREVFRTPDDDPWLGLRGGWAALDDAQQSPAPVFW
jgi:hypothetical protein